MRNKLRTILISAGTVLIFSALFLSLYNNNESRNAGKRANDVLTALKASIPGPTEVSGNGNEAPASGRDLFEMYEPAAAESVSAAGATQPNTIAPLIIRFLFWPCFSPCGIVFRGGGENEYRSVYLPLKH
jgi:hypothetical protein